MPASVFHFKQFSIYQDRCAMKVGTDGVLLGAWAGKNSQPTRILDVGAGTGLIALMMAQRFPQASIFGLEIEPEAAKQAEENVSRSPFAERVNIEHCDFFTWNTAERFDLIVSNPPFYEYAHPSRSSERDLARHGTSFRLQSFLSSAASLLSERGSVAVIIPVNTMASITPVSENLNLTRICKLAPNPQKPFHRVMLEYGKESTEPTHSDLTIEMGGRHEYSSEYKALTGDFYLNF